MREPDGTMFIFGMLIASAIAVAGIGIGFDNIPNVFLHSSLSGNQLAQLASVSEIPTFENSKKQFTDLDKALDEIVNHLKKNNISEAWQIILNWKYYNE